MDRLEASSGSLPNACTKHLVAKLRSFESRLDAIQIEAAASSVASADFASEATQRLCSLEEEIRRLSSSAFNHSNSNATAISFADSCNGEGNCQSAQDLLTTAASSLLEDVKGCTQRLLTAVGQDVSQAIESGKFAAIVAAERVAAEHAARAVAEATQQISTAQIGLTDITSPKLISTTSNEQDDDGYTKSPGRLLAEVRQASSEASAAEARIAVRISQCVNLIDVACSPANRPGLEALRDVVESLETVSARVAMLENSIATPLSPTSLEGSVTNSHNGVSSPSALRGVDPRVLARLNSRLEKLERNLPAMHDRLHECLLVLWSAVREISRELCATVGTSGIGNGVAALHSGKALKNAKRSLSPHRSPRRSSMIDSRSMNTALPAF